MLATAVVLASCGGGGTASGTELLDAHVAETDVPADVRATLSRDAVEAHAVRFPDGEGTVEVEVTHARAGERQYLRRIAVRASDSAGWDLGASLVGNPTNQGTVEAPVHARIVQLTRRRTSACGTSMSQVSLRVTPAEVTVL